MLDADILKTGKKGHVISRVISIHRFISPGISVDLMDSNPHNTLEPRDMQDPVLDSGE
jgi:hypothetical protein